MNEQMKDDLSLLREFVRQKSEAAFAELVRRHVDLVHTAALRQLGGDADLARDATQAVFCELARNARKLLNHRALAGWLYTTARFVATRLRRSETRRATREIAYAMNNTEQAELSQEPWQEIEHLLDSAMHEISAADREAVILRYFRNEPLANIATALGSSENAARMRVDRALEKLRTVLEKRGIRRSSAVLAALLSTHSVLAAPAGLSAVVASSAVGAAGTAAWAGSFLSFMSAMKIKTALGCLALAGTTTGLILYQNQAAKLESDRTILRDQAQTQAAQAPPDPGSVLVDAGELARLRGQNSELMRLRNEVTQLRDQLRNMPAPATAPSQAAQVDPAVMQRLHEEAKRTLGIAKMSVAKGWGLAFHLFAQENEGRMPADLQEAAPFYPQVPEEMSWMHGLAGDDFEIMFHGSLQTIENPSEAIILREREPYAFEDDGSARRTYLFADGHSEIHKAPNGDFESWEIQRQPILRTNSNAPSPAQ